MGVSSKKSKQTTNQNTTATMRPVNPDFVTNSISGIADKINTTFNGLDPRSLVVGPDALQTQAGQGAASLATSPNFTKASDLLGGVASAGPQSLESVNLGDYIKQLMDPNIDNRVQTGLANFDFGAGQAQGQAQLDLANDTTFGGSGGALYKRGLTSDLVRQRADLEAGLRSAAYDKAASLATAQAGLEAQRRAANASLAEQALGRQAAAAGGLADVGATQGAEGRATAATQASIGEMLRMIAQAQAQAPVTALGQQASLLAGLPFNLFQGQDATGSLSGTTTSKSSGAGLGDWLNFFAANAQAAAGAA